MAYKLETTITCDGCGKKVKATVERKAHLSRRGRDLVRFLNIYAVRIDEDLIEIRKSPHDFELDDDSKVACSGPCVLKVAGRLVPKMTDKEDE